MSSCYADSIARHKPSLRATTTRAALLQQLALAKHGVINATCDARGTFCRRRRTCASCGAIRPLTCTPALRSSSSTSSSSAPRTSSATSSRNRSTRAPRRARARRARARRARRTTRARRAVAAGCSPPIRRARMAGQPVTEKPVPEKPVVEQPVVQQPLEDRTDTPVDSPTAPSPEGRIEIQLDATDPGSVIAFDQSIQLSP